MNQLEDQVYQLHEVVHNIILEKERELDFVMTPETKRFLQDTIVTDTITSVNKFIKGQLEHGENFLTEVPHIKEIINESIDLKFYAHAALRQNHTHDERYK